MLDSAVPVATPIRVAPPADTRSPEPARDDAADLQIPEVRALSAFVQRCLAPVPTLQ